MALSKSSGQTVPDYFIVLMLAFVQRVKQSASFWFTMQTPITGTSAGSSGEQEEAEGQRLERLVLWP